MRGRARTAGTRGVATLAAVALGALGVACAGGPRPDYGTPTELAIEEAPLGGEALAQRRQDLARAYGDLMAFQATMASLIDRRDSSGLSSLDDFVSAYMGRHLEPLLAPEWPSGHPEVMEVDANLRFAKGELLVMMRYPRRVQAVIDDIERRYAGRGSMLVEYPPGEQSTIDEALRILRDRKWNG